MTAIQQPFDYSIIDAETRTIVQQKTGEIKALMKRTMQDVIAAGQKLHEVKALLGHGHFGPWIQAEFGGSERTALNFMQVASAFKSATVADLPIEQRALYLLAGSSVPEAARDATIARATAGEKITYAAAKTIIADHAKNDPRTKEKELKRRMAESERMWLSDRRRLIQALRDERVPADVVEIWGKGDPHRALAELRQFRLRLEEMEAQVVEYAAKREPRRRKQGVRSGADQSRANDD
jgi:hypothetical protein